MTGLAEAIPGITDYLDNDGLVKYIINVTGLPAQVILSDEQVAALRQQQQEAAAAQQEAQQEMENSEQARNVAPLVQALQGQAE